MKAVNHKIIVSLILIVLFFIFFLFSVPYYSGDVRNHIFWGELILDEGPAGFYQKDMDIWSYPNYPPVSMLSFAATVWLYRQTDSLFWNLNNLPLFPSTLIPWLESPNVYIAFLKIPAITPFLLSGAFIFAFSRLFKKSLSQSIFQMLLFLFNPGLFYLAVVWGQNDFAQILFIIGAFYFMVADYLHSQKTTANLLTLKTFLAYIFASLSILSKQTVLIVWTLFLITVYKIKGIPQSVISIIFSVVIIWILYLPFNISGPFWPFTYYNETLKSTGFLVADNAINIWGLYSDYGQLDAGKNHFGLTYEHWGFLCFALLFLPLLIKYLKTKFSPELLFYFLFLTSITYFFVFTRMHERYLFFGVIFAHLLFIVKRKYWPNLLFFSLFYFLNIYRGLLQPDFPLLVEFLKNRFYLNWMVVFYFAFLIYNYYCFVFKLKGPKQ